MASRSSSFTRFYSAQLRFARRVARYLVERQTRYTALLASISRLTRSW